MKGQELFFNYGDRYWEGGVISSLSEEDQLQDEEYDD